MRAKWIGSCVAACVVSAMTQVNGQTTTAGLFSGASGDNNLFSNTANWSTFPTYSGSGSRPNFNVTATATSAGNPGQLDAAFNPLLPSGFSQGYVQPYATGTSYIEVLDGGVFRAVHLTIGHQSISARHGQLTLKSGSKLSPDTANNGNLTVGSSAAATRRLIAEAGLAEFGFANLKLMTNGAITFKFGEASVSSFVSTKSNGKADLILDGVVEVDLAALETRGTYTLIQSMHNDTVMTGDLATWLTGEGGSFTLTGSYNGNNFKVLNGGDLEWTLSSADNGGTLILTVITEPS
jgi:hypothetical protein